MYPALYDLLGRVGCVQDAIPAINAIGACSSGAHPYVQNTYDTTVLGTTGSTDFPIGSLTKSVATTYFPEGTQATTTSMLQYDQRGRPITQQMQLSLPASWNVTNPLPTYQQQVYYNNADQPTTGISSMLNPNMTGATTTQVYDSTTGALVGLSNNGNATANLASMTFNASGLPDTVNFQTSTGTALASEHFTYDGNQRAIESTATWQSGSGTSGQIFDQVRSYDPASNIISLSTSLAAVAGQNNSGGSETQNFCYDEQSRLVWAGNSGTQPAAGNGVCGNGTLSNGLAGAGYANSFAYTHLGQLWQGPLNGQGQSQQYLYCDSTHPHQLTGIYAPGSTCSNKSGAVYETGYDAWGNVTTRSYNGSTAALSYDLLDHFVEWNNPGANTQEWYVYDASGNRVLKRSTSNGTTSMTVYNGGEEHTYDASGNNQNNTYYYSLGGRLIGELISNPGSTNLFLTDAVGSIISTFSNLAGTASVQGNQVYGPYGNQRYSKGSMGTTKGFTGQYNDSVTGLDYYVARYYDPAAAVFLSADSVEGNMAGMNPYDYVGSNPETHTDPTGRYIACPDGCGGGGQAPAPSPQPQPQPPYSPPPPPPPPPSSGGWNLWGWASSAVTTVKNVGSTVLDLTLGIPSMVHDVQTIFDGNTSLTDKLWAGGDLALNVVMDATMFIGVGEEMRVAYVGAKLGGDLLVHAGEDMLVHGGEDVISHIGEDALTHGGEDAITHSGEDAASHAGQDAASHGGEGGGGCGGGLSFTYTTQVATSQGEKSIGSLHVGDKVWAYNPDSHKMELEPILHVWINHDTDLVDLTLTSTSAKSVAHAGKTAASKSEVIHTNQKHPFLTKEYGFLPVSKLKVGMHILKADGTVGLVDKLQVVPGGQTMYNLEVAHDHTFTVGDGQWIVHNNNCTKVFQELEDAGHTLDKHFKDTFSERTPGFTASDVQKILDDGRHVFDIKETNLVAVAKLRGKMYRIAYDTTGKLLSIAGEKNGAANILTRPWRFLPPEVVLPNWTNPFR